MDVQPILMLSQVGTPNPRNQERLNKDLWNSLTGVLGVCILDMTEINQYANRSSRPFLGGTHLSNFHVIMVGL